MTTTATASGTYRDTPSAEAADAWLATVANEVRSLKDRNEGLLLNAGIYDRFVRGVANGELSPRRFKELQANGAFISDLEYEEAQKVRLQLEQLRNVAM